MDDTLFQINGDPVEAKPWSLSGLWEAIKLAGLVQKLNRRQRLFSGFGVQEQASIGDMTYRPGYRNRRRYARIALSSRRRHAMKHRSPIQFRRWPEIDGRPTKVIEAEMRARPDSACNHGTALIKSGWRK